MNNGYRIRMKSDVIAHKGTKGMKWGYTDGKPNGKRKAAKEDKEGAETTVKEGNKTIIKKGNKTTIIEDYDGWLNETIRTKKEMSVNFDNKKGGDTVRYETIIRRGKISRAVESGKKKIKNFFKSGKKAVSRFSKRVISNGKKKVASLLKKLK